MDKKFTCDCIPDAIEEIKIIKAALVDVIISLNCSYENPVGTPLTKDLLEKLKIYYLLMLKFFLIEPNLVLKFGLIIISFSLFFFSKSKS